MKTNTATTEWLAYQKLFNAGAIRSELLNAAQAMIDGANRRAALMNLGVMTASERQQIETRWESINAVTEKEMAVHCQFNGFFKPEAGYV